MELNDKIFESVKNALNEQFGSDEEDESQKEQKELFLKICTGTATEEEKEEYKKLSGLNDDISEQLSNYCQLGQKMASQFETRNSTDEKLDFIIQELKEIKELMNKTLKETFNK